MRRGELDTPAGTGRGDAARDDDQQDDAERRRPGAALGFGLAGGVASPASLAGDVTGSAAGGAVGASITGSGGSTGSEIGALVGDGGRAGADDTVGDGVGEALARSSRPPKSDLGSPMSGKGLRSPGESKDGSGGDLGGDVGGALGGRIGRQTRKRAAVALAGALAVIAIVIGAVTARDDGSAGDVEASAGEPPADGPSATGRAGTTAHPTEATSAPTTTVRPRPGTGTPVTDTTAPAEGGAPAPGPGPGPGSVPGGPAPSAPSPSSPTTAPPAGDTTPPSISGLSASSAAIDEDCPEFFSRSKTTGATAVVGDPSGVRSVTLTWRLNGATGSEAMPASGGTRYAGLGPFPDTMQYLQSASLTWSVTAIDNAGNEATTSGPAVTVYGC